MKLTYIFIILFVYNSISAQLKTITDKTTYPFWINVPEKESTEKQPILIFLHGKSLSGTDLNRVRRYGVLRAMDKGRKIPAIVVAPQLAKGSWNPDKVLEVLEYVQKMIEDGTGADKQIAVYNNTKSLKDVVKFINHSFLEGIR